VELTQEAKLINGKKYPLSIGIKEANHEIMLLTDADCVPQVNIGYKRCRSLPGWCRDRIRIWRLS
jgi:hypothetical protein